MEVTANATYKSKGLETLNALLARRSEQLGMCVKSATISTALTVLKSARAQTKNAIGRNKFPNTVVEDTGWYGGFSKTLNKVCARTGTSPYSQRVNLDGRLVNTLRNTKVPAIQRHVYKVIPEHESKKAYYIIAMSPQDALNYENRAAKHRVEYAGGLARNAFGVAISKTYAENFSDFEGSSKSRMMASRLSDVRTIDNGNIYTMRISDNLDYATDALKNGMSSLELALQKASNKVASVINRFAISDLERVDVPFKEIRTRK